MVNKKVIIIVISILLIFAIFLSSRSTIKNDKKTIIDKMIRQSARYATAAEQDESPVVAVLHANYSPPIFTRSPR